MMVWRQIQRRFGWILDIFSSNLGVFSRNIIWMKKSPLYFFGGKHCQVTQIPICQKIRQNLAKRQFLRHPKVGCIGLCVVALYLGNCPPLLAQNNAPLFLIPPPDTSKKDTPEDTAL